MCLCVLLKNNIFQMQSCTTETRSTNNFLDVARANSFFKSIIVVYHLGFFHYGTFSLIFALLVVEQLLKRVKTLFSIIVSSYFLYYKQRSDKS